MLSFVGKGTSSTRAALGSTLALSRLQPLRRSFSLLNREIFNTFHKRGRANRLIRKIRRPIRRGSLVGRRASIYSQESGWASAPGKVSVIGGLQQLLP